MTGLYFAALVSPLESLQFLILKSVAKGGKERKKYVTATKNIVPLIQSSNGFSNNGGPIRPDNAYALQPRLPHFMITDACKRRGFRVSATQLQRDNTSDLTIEQVLDGNYDRM